MSIELKIQKIEYVFLTHAKKRQIDRNISDIDVLDLLENKKDRKRKRNKQKDTYTNGHKDWNYCIEGVDLDNKKIRVIVSFSSESMLVITVIRLEGEESLIRKKIKKKFIYTGFGFPVELQNVEMIEINGTLHPKIDVRKTANSVIESLITQSTRFTGNQVKFIRTYFSMSLREFAKVVNESHTAVMKWEKFANKPTNMDINIESMLRLYICDRTMVQNKQKKSEFYNQYRKVTEIFHHQVIS